MAVEDIQDEWLGIEDDYLGGLNDPQESAKPDVLMDAMAALEKQQAKFRGIKNGGLTYEDLQTFGWELPAVVAPPWPVIVRRITGITPRNRAWGGMNGEGAIPGFTGGYVQYELAVQVDVLLGPNLIVVQDAEYAHAVNWVELLHRLYTKNDTLGGRCDYINLAPVEQSTGVTVTYAKAAYYATRLRVQIGATYAFSGAPFPDEVN